GADYTGRIQEVDIGIPADLTRDLPLELLDRTWTKRNLPARPADANKGTFGRVLAVLGSQHFVGASVLAASGAYRVGAGYITLATPLSIYPIVAGCLTEATFLPLPEDNGAVAEAAVTDVLESLTEENTLLVGSGLSGDADSFVRSLLQANLPPLRGVVLDGDALNALSRWEGWSARVRLPLVLTPHPGEMARLVGSTVPEVQSRRIALAQEKAREWNAVVVLKGAGTVVAAPAGRIWLAPFANPALATAGSGDVLAGAIAGLLAQGLEPATAAACGVYLHGMAGDAARRELGPAGVMAGDLLPELPRAIKSLVEPSAAPAPGGLFGGMLGQGGLGGMDPSALGGLGGMGGAPGGLPGLPGPGGPS
ncbi:MAG: NAD(P)H-hydrate dehydratase, partial [Dehalococcoidia bacterium]